MKNSHKGILPLLCLCFSSVYSEGLQYKGYDKVITISGGVGLTQPGDKQTLIPSRTINLPIIGPSDTGPVITGVDSFILFIPNTYLPNKKTQTIGTGEAFFGLQWAFCEIFNNQLGIAMGGSSDADVKGNLNINSVPSGSRYKYQVNHGKLVARDKLLFANYQLVQPYITGSLGAAFNKSHAYTTSPRIDPNVSAPWFKDNTNSFTFTYSVGLGIQKDIASNWNMSFGYEFENWGKSNLGSGTIGTLETFTLNGTSVDVTVPQDYKGPKIPHLYTHNLLLSLSYLW